MASKVSFTAESAEHAERQAIERASRAAHHLFSACSARSAVDLLKTAAQHHPPTRATTGPPPRPELALAYAGRLPHAYPDGYQGNAGTSSTRSIRAARWTLALRLVPARRRRAACGRSAASAWCPVVVAPAAVQAAFQPQRGAASLPYTLSMVGFAVGGVPMGWLADRVGVALPVAGGAVAIGLGYVAAGLAPGPITFALAYGLLIGFLGCSATFVPLVAEISHCPARRRGIAVSIVASGNYAATVVAVAADRRAGDRPCMAGAPRIWASRRSASSPWCRWRCCCAGGHRATPGDTRARRPASARWVCAPA